MKIRINWGTGIVIAIAIMVSGMLYLVYLATRTDYYLVEKDYYQKSVNYQEKIDKITNANQLHEKLVLTQNGNKLQLAFPKLFEHQTLTGTVQLYSPASEKNDLKLPLKLDEQLGQSISIAKLPRGRYKVQVDWTANQKSYFQELEIILE